MLLGRPVEFDGEFLGAPGALVVRGALVVLARPVAFPGALVVHGVLVVLPIETLPCSCGIELSGDGIVVSGDCVVADIILR